MWPKKLGNEEVYELTRTKPFYDTAANIVFEYYMKDIKKLKDQHQETWLSMIKEAFKT